MDNQEWVRIQRDYLEKQAPLRATWLDESLPAEDRAAAYEQLTTLIQETTKKCPPITGTFYYTQEEADEAKRHGF